MNHKINKNKTQIKAFLPNYLQTHTQIISPKTKTTNKPTKCKPKKRKI